MATKRLYYNDATLCAFQARVLQVQGSERGPAVRLDQTAFYPTSGGQPHDAGTLNNVSVVEGFEDENRQIVHLLEKPISIAEVEAIIHWERRFDHMQQHTGQHILSQAFVKVSNADTLSFHLGEKSATIDLTQSGLTTEAITTVEQLANRIIIENRDVIAHMVGKNELKLFFGQNPESLLNRRTGCNVVAFGGKDADTALQDHRIIVDDQDAQSIHSVPPRGAR